MSNELDIPEDEVEVMPLWSQLISIGMLAALCTWAIIAGVSL